MQIRYGISSMQGWRRSMEDSHICSLDIGDGVAIFGVFDGHGGIYTFYNKEIFKAVKLQCLCRSTLLKN